MSAKKAWCREYRCPSENCGDLPIQVIHSDMRRTHYCTWCGSKCKYVRDVPPLRWYAVFIRKKGKWLQQSVPFRGYEPAQAHAKSVRKMFPTAEKTRVRRIACPTPEGSA